MTFSLRYPSMLLLSVSVHMLIAPVGSTPLEIVRPLWSDQWVKSSVSTRLARAFSTLRPQWPTAFRALAASAPKPVTRVVAEVCTVLPDVGLLNVSQQGSV